mmetsp:Transcript_105378/g.265442  ORF Transcript_105378/g.265442 Transcript_105378/m.265442 type:complete len:107 (+) Transcript_105378:518-838(+)
MFDSEFVFSIALTSMGSHGIISLHSAHCGMESDLYRFIAVRIFLILTSMCIANLGIGGLAKPALKFRVNMVYMCEAIEPTLSTPTPCMSLSSFLEAFLLERPSLGF